jgi:hypothetical protein
VWRLRDVYAGYRVKKIPDPQQRIYVFLTQKLFLSSGKMFWDVHQKSTKSRIRIRNTEIKDRKIGESLACVSKIRRLKWIGKKR